MKMADLNLKDKFYVKDVISEGNGLNKSHSLWARTRVMGGYDLRKNKYGLSELGEVVFDTENLVPLVGAQFAMEQIFGVKGSIDIPQIADVMNLNTAGQSAAGTGGNPYPYGQKVCLFGVGNTGAASNNITAKEVKYNEYNVSGMIPLRYTNDPLSGSEQTQYWGKKTDSSTGIMGYYLKKFDNEPVIHHLLLDGEAGEDGTEVDADYLINGSTYGVESFTEINLTITKKDVREWYEAHGSIDECIVNSIGLFTAYYDANVKDYLNIQLFSKLNIPSEPLKLAKDMNIVYRVYTS